ncbi:capsule assembly Wzi family protein [Marinobacter sp. KM021]|uniref:capsule assembly Wzi family protein n=1 Tax=Marinobacter sp. KM021 TaxID=3075616 RepID=UPI003D6B8FA8
MKSLRNRRLTVFVPALLASSALNAAPWLEPGDLRARHAVQKLADRGHYERGVTTWPIMWNDIDSGITTGVSSDLPATGSQNAYLRFERTEQGRSGFRSEIMVGGTSEPGFVRGFQQKPREEGEVALTVQWQGEYLAMGLSPQYAANPSDDKDFRADGSYVAGVVGNWVVGVGAIDRWWGPGWQSSLLLSTNARPMPAVFVNRADTAAPEHPWLSWIGPWNLTVFAGQMEKERVVPDTQLVGMRLALRPLPGLDIGFSRAIMFGGEGFSNSLSTFWDAFIGDDNSIDGSDPGNQLGAIDIRYGFPVGGQTMSLYMEMMGEDEAGYMPSRKSWLFGSDWTTQFLDANQQWFVEYAITLADDLIGDSIPNYAYSHYRYRTGYQYLGRNMAPTFDGDSETLTLGLFHFMNNGSDLSFSLSHANLNKDGGNRVVQPDNKIAYFVPDGAQKAVIASAGYGTEFMNGWLSLNVQATDKKIRLLGGEQDQWSAAASWTYRF